MHSKKKLKGDKAASALPAQGRSKATSHPRRSTATNRADQKPLAKRFPIVGVGASAGGLEAFKELLRHLPADTGMGFVLVQHLDPQHDSALTQLLARASPMPVAEVTDKMRVEPNHVYVIAPNVNLAIADGVLRLKPRPTGRAPFRSVDFFLESLAADQHECAIGAILSGTASDGTLGLEAIKSEGGITFAQDESARYDSMPRNAVSTGCVDFVLPPQKIAEELVRIARHPYLGGTCAAAAAGKEKERADGAKAARAGAEARRPAREEEIFKKILLLVHEHSRVDFSQYKSGTIHRRIMRRVVLNKHETLQAYASFLRGNAKELSALYSDMLVAVTSFFRNPEAFDILKHQVFPALLARRSDRPVRVWVLGCSTGQEAYSIAMTFVEAAERVAGARKLQVFATDLNEAVLEKARSALYAKSLTQDVSPERLRRFFVEEDGGYRVSKELRQMVVFARQNILSDAPFSHMDLISCRNVLIYLDLNLHARILPIFHYALNPEGFLFLGASESVSDFNRLFEPVDRKQKIFSRKAGRTPEFGSPGRVAHPAEMRMVQASPQRGAMRKGFPTELNAQREADRVTINQFAPPGVLINNEMDVLEFRGATNPYLEAPSGKPTVSLLKLAREGLMLPLRAAVNKARREGKRVRKDGVRVSRNGGARTVSIEVIPLKHVRQRCYLILFGEDGKGARARPALGPTPATAADSKREARRVGELEQEVAETRDYLRSIQEQHEAANEELQAQSEELQSANEELQSLNEELETSKEELESSNEELTTVNDEMATRNTELNQINADLNNLHLSIDTPILLLGRNLVIRRFTPAAEKALNLMGSDVGRPLSSIRHDLSFREGGSGAGDSSRDGGGGTARRGARGRGGLDSAIAGEVRPSPAIAREAAMKQKSVASRSGTGGSVSGSVEEFVAEVIDTVRPAEREVQDKDGHCYLLRVRPYMTLDNKVDGAVLVLTNIDALKRSEREIRGARDYAEAMLKDMKRLHEVGTLCSGPGADLKQCLDAILDAAIALVGADKGNIQLLENDGALKIAAHRGFEPPFLNFFATVRKEEAAVCGTAKHRAERVIVEDVTRSEIFCDQPSLDVLLAAGVRAVQSTPLLSSSGNILGMISCHFARPHSFPERELRLMDLLARQAGDYLERKRTNDALREAVGELEAFSYSIAHDLRSPLRAMNNFAQIVRDRYADRLDDTGRTYLTNISRSGDRLDALIQDVLSYAHVLRAEAPLGRVDLDQVARDVLSTYPNLQPPRVDVHIEGPLPLVVGHAALLTQCLSNLLSNAVKFVDSGVQPRVRIWSVPGEGEGRVRVNVQDNGIGISPQNHQRIFRLFERIHPGTKFEGTGIGLTIVRKAIQRMGGQVGFESEPGKGSTFWFELRRADE